MGDFTQLQKETSQINTQLKTRIGTNKKFGTVDLDAWLFEKLGIKKENNVLDVGCGNGNHIIKIAKLFPEGNYFGIDISKSSITDAEKKSAEENTKINFICGDAADTTTLENGFFDFVLSVYALYYLKDTQKVLNTLKLKLKGGGKFAVMTPYHKNNDEWYSFLSIFMQIPKKFTDISDNFMDSQVLPFAKSNFKNMFTFPFENKIKIPSFDDLDKYWKGNIYHKPEFDENFEKTAKEFFAKNNEFVLTKRALLVIMDTKL